MNRREDFFGGYKLNHNIHHKYKYEKVQVPILALSHLHSIMMDPAV